MDLRFRAARPTDSDIAVPLIFLSGPQAFRYVFSINHRDEALGFLIYAFQEGAGEFGFRNHLIAELNDRPVAVGGLWDHTTSNAFFFDAIRKILSYYGLVHGIKVLLRGLRIERVVRPPNQFGVSYLGHLSVLPEYQGQGIGGALIDKFVEQSRILGYQKIALDVAEGNQARRLYEKKGFIAQEFRKSKLANKFGGVPNIEYMEKDLVDPEA